MQKVESITFQVTIYILLFFLWSSVSVEEFTPNQLVHSLLILTPSPFGEEGFERKKHPNTFLVGRICDWIFLLGDGFRKLCRTEKEKRQSQCRKKQQDNRPEINTKGVKLEQRVGENFHRGERGWVWRGKSQEREKGQDPLRRTSIQ